MNTWSLSWNGLRTVVSLELKQRIRSPRWVVALVAWFLFMGGITALVIYSMWQSDQTRSSEYNPYGAGPLAFGIITLFVLGMSLVIAPAFTSTSINGDRTAGTLATLQATRLSAVEIAAGKLIAAWLAAAVFLVAVLPFIAWSMVLGSISVWQVMVCFAVVFALVAVVCAIGLGWSALISRTSGASVMTYLSVLMLAIISPMVMALATPFTQETTTIKVWGLPEAVLQEYYEAQEKYWEQEDSDGSGMPLPPVEKCTWTERKESIVRVDRLWWLLVPNPFVIVADAAPLPDAARDGLDDYVWRASDPLAGLRLSVRSLAIGPETVRDDCVWLYQDLGYSVDWNEDGTVRMTTENGTPVPYETRVPQLPVGVGSPVWPWGLGAHLLLGGLFFWIAVRRLSVPYGVLPKGVRVA